MRASADSLNRCVSTVSDTNREMVSDTINHEEIERFDPS